MIPHSQAFPSQPHKHYIIGGVAIGLLLYAIGLSWLSRQLAVHSISIDLALLLLAAFSIVVGAIYLLVARNIVRIPSTKKEVCMIIALGSVMRFVVMTNEPFLETDYYRYLWDGAVTASGFNPYEYAPTRILWAQIGADNAPLELVMLSKQAGTIFENINHPHLKSIYPPVAQAVFAISHLLGPWSVNVWRLILFVGDAATLLVVFRLLSQLRLPSSLVVLYWWNPIILREVYGAAHMDVLLLPLVLGAVVECVNRRPYFAIILIALASGIKCWPVLLVPVVLRSYVQLRRTMVRGVLLLIVAMVVIWMPAIPALVGRSSGFLAYAEMWENNAGAFALIQSAWRNGLKWWDPEKAHLAGWAARATAGIFVLGWTLWQSYKPISDDCEVVRRCFFVSAGVFMLSPTQFPWYYLWLIPFFPILGPNVLLIYTFLVPLYYVQEIVPVITWVEHGVVWWLIIWAAWSKMARRASLRQILCVTPRNQNLQRMRNDA